MLEKRASRVKDARRPFKGERVLMSFAELQELVNRGWKIVNAPSINSLRIGSIGTIRDLNGDLDLDVIRFKVKDSKIKDANPDGTVSPDEEWRSKELVQKATRLKQELKREAYEIGGSFRGPGIWREVRMELTKDSKTKDSLFKGQKVTAIKSEQGLREGETYTVLGEEEIIKQIVGEGNAIVYKLQDSSGNVIVIENPEGLFYEVKDSKTKDKYELVWQNSKFEIYEDENNEFELVRKSNKAIIGQYATIQGAKLDAQNSWQDDWKSGKLDNGTKDTQRELLAKLAEKAGDKEYADDVRSGKVPSSMIAERINYYQTKVGDSEENESLKVKIGEIKKNMDAARKMGYDTEPYQKEIDKLETKDAVALMECMECGHKFKKNLSSNTFEVKCPKCGGYDVEVISGDSKDSSDVYTKDPLTKKGEKILAAMKKVYGEEKGEQIFYASKNKGTIENVDKNTSDSLSDMDKKQLAQGKKFKIVLPSGMGEPLYTNSFSGAVEMSKEYGKGTTVVDLTKVTDSKTKDISSSEISGIKNNAVEVKTVYVLYDKRFNHFSRMSPSKGSDNPDQKWHKLTFYKATSGVVPPLSLNHAQKAKEQGGQLLRTRGNEVLGLVELTMDSKTKDDLFISHRNKGTITGVDKKTKDTSPNAKDVTVGSVITFKIGGGFVQRASVTKVLPEGFMVQAEDGELFVPIRDFQWKDSKTKDAVPADLSSLSDDQLMSLFDTLSGAGRNPDNKDQDEKDKARVQQELRKRGFKGGDAKTTDDKRMKLADLVQKAKEGYFELQSDPKPRNHVEIKYPDGKKEWVFVEDQEIKIIIGDDPVNPSPAEQKVEGNDVIYKEYTLKQLPETGEFEVYASKNKGAITGVDRKTKDSKVMIEMGRINGIKYTIEEVREPGSPSFYVGKSDLDDEVIVDKLLPLVRNDLTSWIKRHTKDSDIRRQVEKKLQRKGTISGVDSKTKDLDLIYPEDFKKYGWIIRQNGGKIIAKHPQYGLTYEGSPYEIIGKLRTWLTDYTIMNMIKESGNRKTKDSDIRRQVEKKLQRIGFRFTNYIMQGTPHEESVLVKKDKFGGITAQVDNNGNVNGMSVEQFLERFK